MADFPGVSVQMPYKIKKRGKGYKVTTPNHPQGFSKKPLSKKRAKKQLAAIHMNSTESVTTNLLAAIKLSEGDEQAIPRRFTHGPAERKPSQLPTVARGRSPDPEEKAFLDKLHVFDVDGEDLEHVDLPTGDGNYFILHDINTHLCWLANTAGYNYPRYVIDIGGQYDRVEDETNPHPSAY